MLPIIVLLLSATALCVNAHSICYPPYGCFSDEAPYNQALVRLPEHPTNVDTKFRVYTRSNPLIPDYVDPLDSLSPARIKFNTTKNTVMFVHGYLESPYAWYIGMLIVELLKYEDMNVIFCDWKKGSAFPYHQAVGNTRIVGAQVSRMIEVLRNNTGLDLAKFRLIGFSLGAHIAGYAGRNLRRKGIILPRITGLDPAAPYFEKQHIDVRLDPTDAEFVDVTHTDSKTLIFNGFGTTQEMGHIDFFPNGGYHQVGCGKLDIGAIQYLACSHYRAIRYFMESINSKCPYYGYPCTSYKDFTDKKCTTCGKDECPKMSFHVQKPKQKQAGVKYYLKTHKEFPYCGHHYKLKFYTGNKYFADLDGYVTIELIGTNGTEKVTLPYESYDPGTVQTHVVLVKKHLGDLRKVAITHSRILDVWYLIGVSVTQLWSNTQYTACYNRWLNNSDNIVNVAAGVDVNSCTGFI